MAAPQHAAVPIAPTTGIRGHPLLGVLLLAMAIAVVVHEEHVRTVEATLMAPLLALVLDGGAVPVDAAVMIGIGSNDVYRLAITAMCSTAVLLVPLLGLAGLILLLPRFQLRSVLAGLAAAMVIASVANFTRYGLAAWALGAFGMDGFEVVHRWVGSLLVIGAFAVSFLLMLRIASGPRGSGGARPRRPRRERGAAPRRGFGARGA